MKARVFAAIVAILAAAWPGTSGAASSRGQGGPLQEALHGLVSRNPADQRRAAIWLEERGQPDAIPPMVDALRYRPFQNPQLLAALRALAGVDLGDRYEPWAEWMVRNGIEGPPGYRRWKADFLARLNGRFGVFLDPERPTTIAYEEIQWGGVAPEGIPSLDRPNVVGAEEADYLGRDELVFGVTLPTSTDAPTRGGAGAVVARAYPLRVLDWHEMTNDVVAGVPVALSYCTLCGSGILFDRRVGDRQFTFATSGLLYRSNKLMFDKETETLWSNLTGKPVLGDLVEEGIELQVLPLVVTTWGEWRRVHPDTTVLSLETGYERDYSPGKPYGEYFASPDTMFPVGVRDDRLPAKAWVFGLRLGEATVAFDLDAVHEAGVVNTSIDDRPVVLVAGQGRAVRAYAGQPGSDLPVFLKLAAGRPGRQGGSESGPTRVAPGPESGQTTGPPGRGAVIETVVAEDGSRWQVTDLWMMEEGGSGRLPRLSGHLAYWFGWYAFFPDTELWRGL